MGKTRRGNNPGSYIVTYLGGLKLVLLRKIVELTGLPKTTVNRLQKQARARGIL